MASMKAKKGNPFQYDTAYSLIRSGYVVKYDDLNLPGLDLRVYNKQGALTYYVECKHHKKFSWNELVKYFNKTAKLAKEEGAVPMLIFRANHQPVLIMVERDGIKTVLEYNDYFAEPWSKRPKGYKLWKEN